MAVPIDGPYIESHMIDVNDTTDYDVNGLVVYDGLIHELTRVVRVPTASTDVCYTAAPTRHHGEMAGCSLIRTMPTSTVAGSTVRMNPCYNLHKVDALCPAWYDPLAADPCLNHTDTEQRPMSLSAKTGPSAARPILPTPTLTRPSPGWTNVTCDCAHQ